MTPDDLEAAQRRHDDFVTLYAGPVEAMTAPFTASGAVLCAAAASAEDVPRLLAALSEAQRERDEARVDADAMRHFNAKNRAKVERMRPVVEAARAVVADWRKDPFLEIATAQVRAQVAAVDSYETKESTDGN